MGERTTKREETASDIEITDEYRRVEELVGGGEPVVFVTGKAGTGKSTLIHHLRGTVEGNCVVVAPTGVAAMNVRGATIHSFFRFPPRTLSDDDVRTVRFKKPYKKLDLVIVDEVSMVRADVLDAMDRFLRLNGPKRRHPFGGVQVVLVGDLHQLPPVVSRGEEADRFHETYAGPYFFDSRAFAGARVAAVELTRIFRQHDDEFIGLLNDIRTGHPGADTLERLNARVTHEVDPDRETVLSTTNAIADRINKSRLSALPGDRRTYTGEAEGSFQLTGDRLPSPLELHLKRDARVMFTKNDAQGRWVNGSLGVVEELSPRRVRVALDGDGQRVDVDRATWETYRYEFDEEEDTHVPVVSGAFEQLPLTPAWAVTIHKSQGKTLSRVRIDLGHSAFAPGQVYVALSRCRRLDDLTLSRPVTPRDIFCDPRVSAFYRSMLEGTHAGRLNL
jgi:ATP-dependent exoDNAse (exonuclease V) alpha subunit